MLRPVDDETVQARIVPPNGAKGEPGDGGCTPPFPRARALLQARRREKKMQRTAYNFAPFERKCTLSLICLSYLSLQNGWQVEANQTRMQQGEASPLVRGAPGDYHYPQCLVFS